MRYALFIALTLCGCASAHSTDFGAAPLPGYCRAAFVHGVPLIDTPQRVMVCNLPAGMEVHWFDGEASSSVLPTLENLTGKVSPVIPVSPVP